MKHLPMACESSPVMSINNVKQEGSDSTVGKNLVRRNEDFLFFLGNMFQEQVGAKKDDPSCENVGGRGNGEMCSNEIFPAQVPSQNFYVASNFATSTNHADMMSTSSNVLNGQKEGINNTEGKIQVMPKGGSNEISLNESLHKETETEKLPIATINTKIPNQSGLTPTSSDVLNGRGKRTNNHEGNIRYREIVLKHKHEYVTGSSSKLRKNSIIAKVMADVQGLNPPGRFLELDDQGSWIDIGDKRAKKKIGQALREDAHIFHTPRTPTPPQKVAHKKVGGISVIEGPTSSDVLCGRGKRVNGHEGNIRFRNIVSTKKLEYLSSSTTKLRKFHIALQVVAEIQKLYPPGRFLELDPKTGLWVDIGDVRARKKAGQALREDSQAFCKKREEEMAQSAICNLPKQMFGLW